MNQYWGGSHPAPHRGGGGDCRRTDNLGGFVLGLIARGVGAAIGLVARSIGLVCAILVAPSDSEGPGPPRKTPHLQPGMVPPADCWTGYPHDDVVASVNASASYAHRFLSDQMEKDVQRKEGHKREKTGTRMPRLQTSCPPEKMMKEGGREGERDLLQTK